MKPENLEFKNGIHKDYEWIATYWESEIMQHFCAYVKIPKEHPYYKSGIKMKYFTFNKKRHYHRDYGSIPLHVHGGLTFAELIGKENIENYPIPFTYGLWVGWDYNHAFDRYFLSEEKIKTKSKDLQDLWNKMPKELTHDNRLSSYPFHDKQWSLKELQRDCKDAIRQLIKA